MFGFVKRYFQRKKRKKELIEKKSFIDEAIKNRFEGLSKDAKWVLDNKVIEIKSLLKTQLPTSPNELENKIRESLRLIQTLESNISSMQIALGDDAVELTKEHIHHHESGMTSKNQGSFQSTDNNVIPQLEKDGRIFGFDPTTKKTLKIVEELNALD